MNNMEWLLDVDEQMFSYDSISQEAAQTLPNYLDREEDSSDPSHFVVKYYCDRKSIIERIFGKKWEEQVSGKVPEILKNAAEVYHKEVLTLFSRDICTCILLSNLYVLF